MEGGKEMNIGKRYTVCIFDTPFGTTRRMTMSEILTYIKIFGDRYDVIVMDEKERKDG